MPPQNTHEIFRKELELFREHERSNGRAVYDNQFDFLLQSLRRASLAVVEEIQKYNNDRVKEWHKTCLVETFDNGRFWEAKDMQQHLLATAREITGTDQTRR